MEIIVNVSEEIQEVFTLRTDAKDANLRACPNDCLYKKKGESCIFTRVKHINFSHKGELSTKEGQKWGYCFKHQPGCQCK